MKRFFSIALGIFDVVAISWFVLSFLDIVLHNLNPNPVYHPLNFFIMMMGGGV